MKKTSFRVTLLLVLVLSITMWNILRLWTALAWRSPLIEFAGAELSTVEIISGAVWSLAGIFSVWYIDARKKWAGMMILAAAIAYSTWYWVARLVWQSPRPNWVFAVIVNVILLVFVVITIKPLSREAYEREIENPTVK